MFPDVVLADQYIQLEPIGMHGLEEFHAYSILPEFYNYLEFDPFTTLGDSKDYLQKLIKRSSAFGVQYWFIRLLKDDVIVGTFGVHSYDEHRKSIEIGYGVSPRYSGRGIFRRSAKILLHYLFDDLAIRRVAARTARLNHASIRGLKAVGFQEEGVMRDYFRFSDGNWYDAVLLSCLHEDYKSAQ